MALILLVPSAIVAPFAAYAGDRFRRDRVLLIDYLVQGVAMGATAVTLFVDAAPWVVYASATIASISITFTRPAQNSLIPALTETPDDLTATNVVTGIVEGAGKMLGPLAAGVLLGLSGPGAVFAVFAGVTLLGAIFVSRVRADVSAVTPPGRVGASDVWRETLAGFTTLRREREPRLVVLLLASSDIVVGALDVLFVATAIDLLGIGQSGAGYLERSVRCRSRHRCRRDRGARWTQAADPAAGRGSGGLRGTHRARGGDALSRERTDPVRGRRRWAHARGRRRPHAAATHLPERGAVARVRGARGTQHVRPCGGVHRRRGPHPGVRRSSGARGDRGVPAARHPGLRRVTSFRSIAEPSHRMRRGLPSFGGSPSSRRSRRPRWSG